MPIATNPEWQQLALYALGGALVLVLLFNIPFVGRIFRGLFSIGLLAFALFVLLQQAPFEPGLARLTQRLGIDGQQVVGNEVRIRMSPDGHFWARTTINGHEQRMLIDSGATITTLSADTAQAAEVHASGLMPVILRTANGDLPARTGKIDRLRLGDIEARRLHVVVSPAFGSFDVLGMNFLSQLASWRVEGRTLILVPAPRSKSVPLTG